MEFGILGVWFVGRLISATRQAVTGIHGFALSEPRVSRRSSYFNLLP